MDQAPPVFYRNIAQHNRHCWLGAGLSLLGAALAWIFLAALITALILLEEVVRTGNTGLYSPPPWLPSVLGGAIIGLFAWAAIDRHRRRFRPVDDRAIIGWHLVGDCLLAPARMTFAVFDQIASRVTLNAVQRDEAWRLLEVIASKKRAASALGQYVRDTTLLPKLLLALQLTGWIDLHRGEGDWFYALRSDAEQNYRLLKD